MITNEITIWSQKPSQKRYFWRYTKFFLLSFVFYLLPNNFLHFNLFHGNNISIEIESLVYMITIVCLINIAVLFLVNYTTEYVLTSERIIVKQGILTRYNNQLELYRVKDYILVAPLTYRMFGLSQIKLVTADATQKELVLDGIFKGETVIAAIRDYVEIRRDSKGSIYQVF